MKNVYRLQDTDDIIEMTLVQNKSNTDVFYVPTHHFCSLGCKMCHLTSTIHTKEMRPIQFPHFEEALYKTAFRNLGNLSDAGNPSRRTSKENCLISFMGVGEPLLNLDLIRNIFLNEKRIKENCRYNNIGYALSTVLPNADIQPLFSLVDLGMPLKLHFSLHTPFSDERFSLLPGTSVNVPEALELLCEYRDYFLKKPGLTHRFLETHTVNDPVEIHYTLIKDINDSYSHLAELISLLKAYPIQTKFILFNPIGELTRSENLSIWMNSLCATFPELNIVAYEPPGREIGSSCGEFTKHYYHHKIESPEEYEEFLTWQSAHQITEGGNN